MIIAISEFVFSAPTTFHFSSICQEYFPPSHPSRSLPLPNSLVSRLAYLSTLGLMRNTNKVEKDEWGCWVVNPVIRWAVCFTLRFVCHVKTLEELSGVSMLTRKHTHTYMNKGPCHPSPSPLMSSISFPHSFTWPYQPQSCWDATVSLIFFTVAPPFSPCSASRHSWSPPSPTI